MTIEDLKGKQLNYYQPTNSNSDRRFQKGVAYLGYEDTNSYDTFDVVKIIGFNDRFNKIRFKVQSQASNEEDKLIKLTKFAFLINLNK